MAKPETKKRGGDGEASAILKPRRDIGKKNAKKHGSGVKSNEAGGNRNKRGDDLSGSSQQKKRKNVEKAVDEAEARSSKAQKTEKGKPLDRKAKKELAEHRKRQRKPNFDIEKEVVMQWEKFRKREMHVKDRSGIISETLEKMKGKMVQMAKSHSCSRVLQSCIKHCQEKERNEIFQELRPSFLSLCVNTYACHVANKMISLAKKGDLPQLLSAVHGVVVRLLRHPCGSSVVENLYQAANGSQKNDLVSEFFHPEFRLFKNIGRNKVSEVISNEPAKHKTIVEHMTLAIQPLLEKGIVDHSIIHRVLVEYLSVSPMAIVKGVVDQLSGPLLLRMLHTPDGAKLSVLCVRHGTPKERKKIVKALKGQVLKVAYDDHGYAVLLSIIDVVDDTELVNKVIMSELAKEIKELSLNKYGQRLILHFLAPNAPRYFPSELLKTLKCPIKFYDNCGDAGDGDADTENACISKKDPLLRRTELLSKSGFAQKLVETCAANAGNLLRSMGAKDVICEVARGGVDGILLKASPEGISSVHKAIANLAALPKDKETDEEHVLEHYHASRTIRRLVLERSCHEADGGSAAFARVLWSVALEGRCETWAQGHSAKVVSAFRDSEDPAVRRVAKSGIDSLVRSGLLDSRKAKTATAAAPAAAARK